MQQNAEGDCPEEADSSNCNDHYPEPGRYACADHPTAVRVEGNFFSYGHFDEKMLGTHKGKSSDKKLVKCYTKYIHLYNINLHSYLPLHVAKKFWLLSCLRKEELGNYGVGQLKNPPLFSNKGGRKKKFT